MRTGVPWHWLITGRTHTRKTMLPFLYSLFSFLLSFLLHSHSLIALLTASHYPVLYLSSLLSMVLLLLLPSFLCSFPIFISICPPHILSLFSTSLYYYLSSLCASFSLSAILCSFPTFTASSPHLFSLLTNSFHSYLYPSSFRRFT